MSCSTLMSQLQTGQLPGYLVFGVLSRTNICHRFTLSSGEAETKSKVKCLDQENHTLQGWYSKCRKKIHLSISMEGQLVKVDESKTNGRNHDQHWLAHMKLYLQMNTAGLPVIRLKGLSASLWSHLVHHYKNIDHPYHRPHETCKWPENYPWNSATETLSRRKISHHRLAIGKGISTIPKTIPSINMEFNHKKNP